MFVTHFKESFSNPFQPSNDNWIGDWNCPSSNENNLGGTGIQKTSDNIIVVATRFELDTNCLTASIGVE